MRPAQRAATRLALTAVAAITLAGCAADTSVERAGSQAPEATAPAAFHPDSLVTVTFPDGRLSFQHPKAWHVEFFQPSASPLVATATVSDPTSQAKISIYTGNVADVVASNAERTVLETDPVPGLRGHSVPTPHSSFFVDRSDGAAQYRMGLTAGLPVSPDGKVQDGLIMLGDRVLTADVVFTGQPFANDEEAKAWYWGAEGQALKVVLMSLAATAALPSTSASEPAASAPAAAEPVTFTFPDGRLSFAHPAGWQVHRDGAIESPAVENAAVYDASGNEQVRIFYGEVGGSATGPLTRSVFYSEPVPGLDGQTGPAVAHASFFVDHIDGEPHYRMALTGGAAIRPDGGQAADVVIVGGNRVLAATVVFSGGPFASDEAAKAWFAGEEGQVLKALLTSFSYR
jgi:hypothetical protein